MDKNFRVRLLVGLGMFLVSIIGLYTFNSIPFKVIFGRSSVFCWLVSALSWAETLNAVEVAGVEGVDEVVVVLILLLLLLPLLSF